MNSTMLLSWFRIKCQHSGRYKLKHYHNLATVICYTNQVERSSTVLAWHSWEILDPAPSSVYDPARLELLWPGFKRAFLSLGSAEPFRARLRWAFTARLSVAFMDWIGRTFNWLSNKGMLNSSTRSSWCWHRPQVSVYSMGWVTRGCWTEFNQDLNKWIKFYQVLLKTGSMHWNQGMNWVRLSSTAFGELSTRLSLVCTRGVHMATHNKHTENIHEDLRIKASQGMEV